MENNSSPLGVQLVNSRKTNKTSGAGDLVELAKAVQKVSGIVDKGKTKGYIYKADKLF